MNAPTWFWLLMVAAAAIVFFTVGYMVSDIWGH